LTLHDIPHLQQENVEGKTCKQKQRSRTCWLSSFNSLLAPAMLTGNTAELEFTLRRIKRANEMSCRSKLRWRNSWMGGAGGGGKGILVNPYMCNWRTNDANLECLKWRGSVSLANFSGSCTKMASPASFHSSPEVGSCTQWVEHSWNKLKCKPRGKQVTFAQTKLGLLPPRHFRWKNLHLIHSSFFQRLCKRCKRKTSEWQMITS
jgi:hypothetical protein